MAVIEERGPYQFRAKVRVKGTPSLSETFPTRREAEEWAEQTEKAIKEKTFVDMRHLKGKRLYDLLDYCQEKAVPSKKGAKQELNFILRLKRLPLARKELLDCGLSDFREYRNTRLLTVSKGTVIRELGMISSFYNFAISECNDFKGLKNPIEGLKRPAAPKGRTRRFVCEMNEADYEYTKIVEASNSPALKAFLYVAVNSAMRRGEAAEMEIPHVNLRDATVFLPDTKNGDDRTIPILPGVAEVLREVIGDRKEGRVFGVAADSLTQAFGRARKRAREIYEKECLEQGIAPDPQLFKDLRLHDARHEATSRLFEDLGMSLVEAAAVTGHRDYRQLRRYTHLNAKFLAQKMAERVAANRSEATKVA